MKNFERIRILIKIHETCITMHVRKKQNIALILLIFIIYVIRLRLYLCAVWKFDLNGEGCSYLPPTGRRRAAAIFRKCLEVKT